MQDGVADAHPVARRARSRGPTTTRFGAGVGREHVERLAAPATPIPRRWPTVKSWWPRWLPSTRPLAVDDLALAVREAAVAGEERALALAGEEAEVLALGARRRPGSPAAAAISRTSGLVSSASGKRSRASDARRAAPRACRSGPWRGRPEPTSSGPSAVVGDARVVAGREAGRRRAGRRARPSRRSAARRCSARTGSGSGPRRGRRGSRRRPRRGSACSRSIVRCGRPSECASARAPTTASGEQQLRAPSVCAVGPQLQRHRDDVGAALALEERRDGAVDPAAHRDQRRARRAARRRAGRAAAPAATAAVERAVQRVGGEVGRVAALGREPAELGGDVGGADARGVEQPSALGQRGDRRRRPRSRAAQPSASKRARRDAPVADVERDPDEVAARRAAGRAAGPALGRRGRDATRPLR